MYNRTGQKGRKAQRGVSQLLNNLLGSSKRSRNLTELELYSRENYAERIEPRVQQEFNAQKPTTRGNRLRIVRACTKEAYKEETEEFRKTIRQQLKELKAAKSSGNTGDPTPEEMQRYVTLAIYQIKYSSL